MGQPARIFAAAVALGLTLAGLLQLLAVRTRFPDLEAAFDGAFRTVEISGRPAWSSQPDESAGTGRLTLGPLPASHALLFEVRGPLASRAGSLYFQNAATGARMAPAFLPGPGRGAPVLFQPPAGWRNETMLLQAIDGSAAAGDWIAITEPVAIPWWAAWFHGVPARVTSFWLIGLVVACGAVGLKPWIQRERSIPPPLQLPLACIGLALAGYLVFWAHLLHAGIGITLVVGLIAAALTAAGRRALRTNAPTDPEWFVPLALMALIGTFHVAALHQFAGETPMSSLARERFVANVPTDNTIPQAFARPLQRNEDPRSFAGEDWRSSDRPPLQTGWSLLFAATAEWLRAGFDPAMQAAGVWFQLLWIPAVWAWLRLSGESPQRAALVIASVAATGFFLFHTVYVWPKLGCAALVLMAFTCWFVTPSREPIAASRILAGCVAAALAWLAHGGAAFSLLALAPSFVLRRRTIANVRAWGRGAAIAGALILAWVGYQKFYDPPGNRLLKWHLAGAIAVDDRGTLETLADAYAATFPVEWLRDRATNFATLFQGDWMMRARFDVSSPDAWRHQEWFHVFFAPGWWLTGVVVAAVLTLWRRPSSITAGLTHALGWSLLTFVVWPLLLFLPGTTFVHHGSLAPLLVLIPLGATVLARCHAAVFGVVAVVQVVAFALVWLAPPTAWPGLPVSSASVALMVACALGLAVLITRAGPARVGDAATPPRSPPSSAGSNSPAAQT